MTIRRSRLSVSNLAAVFWFGLLAGCGSNGDSSLNNDNPGSNDLNVVVAFSDSITQGSECSCAPYPARLAGLIGKVVYNTGVGGSSASDNVGRTQEAINKYHPAFMFILYGVNDVIHGDGTSGIAAALSQMVFICKQNNVVPVLMTYPRPILGHQLFAGGTLSLNRSIRQIASAEGIKCVDLEQEFSAGSDPLFPEWPTTDPNLMSPDGLHPNDAGTQIIALACADLF